MDNDIWDCGNQVIAGKIYRKSLEGPKVLETMKRIVNKLFPSHPEGTIIDDTNTVEAPRFLVEELNEAVQNITNGK